MTVRREKEEETHARHLGVVGAVIFLVEIWRGVG